MAAAACDAVVPSSGAGSMVGFVSSEYPSIVIYK